jgi:DNA helicase-2/ATP-dependent DNA helicase PcrA
MISNNISDFDISISKILDINNPTSFFLFAGAGSGKTRSLVNVLNILTDKYGNLFHMKNQKIAVITYTNAACDEIKNRIKFNPLCYVSTIHSFLWDLISPYTPDIKEWLYEYLNDKIEEYTEKQKRARSTESKSYKSREKSLEIYNNLLTALKNIKKFVNNPNGDNNTIDSLNHAEVLKAASFFLSEKKLMQKILISSFPILLIDESQDTNKDVMDAFLKVESDNKNFSLGLFGDTMQRIYGDGKENLEKCIPNEWPKLEKNVNFRSPKRIIELINRIRNEVDHHEQSANSEKEGIVKVFISSTDDQQSFEKFVKEELKKNINKEEYESNVFFNTFILEHQMAANRLGFANVFESLYSIDKYKNGILDGSLSMIRFFSELIFSIKETSEHEKQFQLMNIIRENSDFFNNEIDNFDKEKIELMRNGIKKLLSLWNEDNDPKCIEILKTVSQTNILNIPLSLQPFVDIEDENKNENDEEYGNVVMFLNSEFSEICSYKDYLNKNSGFDTLQGVKGLEFNNVIVILNDDESRGYLFKFDKLFGAKPLSKTDIENMAQGKDSSIDRVRRLFYVACSRAIESLTVVIYSNSPDKVKKTLVSKKWFRNDEIIIY